ncbi:MAG: hypothetical protein EU533_08365 [Promethearchaeota archaeon]|nr:MAG: hypothetical protein EU533_08365 [Candidatus Lokiarchaeota archaeon]
MFSLFASGLMYFFRVKDREDKDEKFLLTSFALFLLGLALCRFLIFFADYYIQGYYKGHAYHGDYESSPIFTMLNLLGYLIWWIFLTISCFFIERALNRTFYALSLLNIIFLVIISLNIVLNSFYFLVFLGIDIVFLFVFFILYRNKLTPIVESDASFVLMGAILFWIGFFVEITGVRQLCLINPIFPSLFFLVGALIQHNNRMIKQALFTNSSLIILTMVISYILLRVSLYYVILLFIATFLYALIMIFCVSREISLIRSEGLIDIDELLERSDPTFDFLKMMGRIKKEQLSDEEITLYKEKRICLVCKGKSSGFVYICSHCDAIYCQKCAHYIVKMDNICWACENSLDPSLRIKEGKEKKESKASKIEDAICQEAEESEIKIISLNNLKHFVVDKVQDLKNNIRKTFPKEREQEFKKDVRGYLKEDDLLEKYNLSQKKFYRELERLFNTRSLKEARYK